MPLAPTGIQRTPAKARLILFNKPFAVMCQFTDKLGRKTLKDYVDVPGVYPAGRLDFDSEGLLVLTNDARLKGLISEPRFKMEKTYFAQVEGRPDESAIDELRRGVLLKDGLTRPAIVELVDEPVWLWQRTPPIRYRANIPTAWLCITITEGKNRQVRRMTAAIGHPTLRLIRYAIGAWTLKDLAPGEWTTANAHSDQPEQNPPDGAHRKNKRRL